mmetsp:Transcript_26746/g.73583  ORF Transcript_26746/g.73583 Transcript_26746/m.73583 type:complete len:104 (+) Transcript_26746:1002-1313(+)
MRSFQGQKRKKLLRRNIRYWKIKLWSGIDPQQTHLSAEIFSCNVLGMTPSDRFRRCFICLFLLTSSLQRLSKVSVEFLLLCFNLLAISSARDPWALRKSTALG